MTMTDWKVSNYVDPDNPSDGETWVYKENPSFPGIHFSMSVDDAAKSHMGTDTAPKSYYFGATKTFAGAPASPATQTTLTNAWKDYYTV